MLFTRTNLSIFFIIIFLGTIIIGYATGNIGNQMPICNQSNMLAIWYNTSIFSEQKNPDIYTCIWYAQNYSSSAYMDFHITLNYSNGTPVTTTTNFTFKLYKDNNSSSLLTIHKELSPEVFNIFHFNLGVLSFDNSNYYLGYAVNNDNESTPRYKIHSIVYDYKWIRLPNRCDS